ncbi:hypothetical protein D3C73_595620 [compost metagenome]
MHDALCISLRIGAGKQIGRAIEAQSHFERRIEHFGYPVTERFHHRRRTTLEKLQDAEAPDRHALLGRQDVDAAFRQRQKHAVDDALAILATSTVLRMGTGDSFGEAVIVQVQQPWKNEPSGTVEHMIGIRRPRCGNGSDPISFDHHPLVAFDNRQAFLANEDVAAINGCGSGCLLRHLRHVITPLIVKTRRPQASRHAVAARPQGASPRCFIDGLRHFERRVRIDDQYLHDFYSRKGSRQSTWRWICRITKSGAPDLP